MLLSYLIIALSVSFAPLAQGRPAGTPANSLNSSHAEPGTLLGRPYSVQERREPSRSLLPRVPYAGYAGYRTAESPRRSKPYAKYLAERSDDVWAHEHGRRANADAPNYVSYVGAPPPPAEPAEPVAPFVAIAPPAAPTAPTAPVGPTSSLTNPTSTVALPVTTSSSIPGSVPVSSASAIPTVSTTKKTKSTKGKSKSKGKGEKQATKS